MPRKPVAFAVPSQAPATKLAEPESNVFRRMTHDTGVDLVRLDRRYLAAALQVVVANGWMLSFSRNPGLPGIKLVLFIDREKHIEYAGTTEGFEELLKMVIEAGQSDAEDVLAGQRPDAGSY